MWDCFISNVNNAVDKYVPISRSRQVEKKQPWVTGEALRAIQEKNKAWKKYKYCKNEQNYCHYMGTRNTVTRLCRSAKKQFEKKL